MKKYERGTYPRGHNVACKHCGLPFSFHFVNMVERGICQGGYEPGDKKTWDLKETVYQIQRQKIAASQKT